VHQRFPRLRKPQELLQALVAFGGTEVSAGVLIDALWPNSEGDAAYHALESALHRSRQLLGARDAVRMDGGKVSLSSIVHDDRLCRGGMADVGDSFLNGVMSSLSPGRGRLADDAPERTGEMRLIAHSAA
jgi:hypothetical protein